jgi:hypothetical protein
MMNQLVDRPDALSFRRVARLLAWFERGAIPAIVFGDGIGKMQPSAPGTTHLW